MNAPWAPPPSPAPDITGREDVILSWALTMVGLVSLLSLIAWVAVVHLRGVFDTRRLSISKPSIRVVRTVVFLLIGLGSVTWAFIADNPSIWVLGVAAFVLPFILNRIGPAEPAVSPAKPEPEPEPGSGLTGEDKEWFDTWAIHYGTPPEKPTPKAPSLRKMRLRRPGDPS